MIMGTMNKLALVLALVLAVPAVCGPVEDLVARLNAVKNAAKELRGGKVSADAYLAALDGAQDAIVSTLGARGVKVRKIARFDFRGLPVPSMLRNASRTVQEDAVISSTGHLEIGRGRNAGALLVEPDENGAFVNRMAAILKRRFDAATVIEAGSVDNEGAAAAFSGDGNYMSIPLCDAFADAVSYMTFHELCHLAAHVGAATQASVFDGKLKGDKLAGFFADPLYAAGFTIDEMAAYPEGVQFSSALVARQGGKALAIPYSGAEWKVLEATVFDHQLRVLSTDRHRGIVLDQLVKILEPFLNACAAANDAVAVATPMPATVEAMNFIGENLNLAGAGEDVQFSLELMFDALIGEGTPLARPLVSLRSKAAGLSIEVALDAGIAKIAMGVLSDTPRKPTPFAAGTPAFLLHAAVSASARDQLAPLPKLVAGLRALNAKLKAARDGGQLAEAEAVVAEMVTLTRSLSPARYSIRELQRELGF